MAKQRKADPPAGLSRAGSAATAHYRQGLRSQPWGGHLERWHGDHPLDDSFDFPVAEGVDHACANERVSVDSMPGRGDGAGILAAALDCTQVTRLPVK